MDLPRPLQAGPIHLVGWLNRLRLFVQKMTNIQGSEFIHVKHGPSGHRVDLALAKLIERIPKSEGLALTDVIQTFRIVSVGNGDAITCEVYNEEEDTGSGAPYTSVAKLWPMRASSYDGETFTDTSFFRTQSWTFSAVSANARHVTYTESTLGAYEWTEVLINPYVRNQVILAAKLPFETGSGYIWQELNTHARMWGKVETTVVEA